MGSDIQTPFRYALKYRLGNRTEDYQICSDFTIQVNCWNAVILLSSGETQGDHFATILQVTECPPHPLKSPTLNSKLAKVREAIQGGFGSVGGVNASEIARGIWRSFAFD